MKENPGGCGDWGGAGVSTCCYLTAWPFWTHLSLPSLPGQVFFVESVCDDPDVIAANILVGDSPAYRHLSVLSAMCYVCVGG